MTTQTRWPQGRERSAAWVRRSQEFVSLQRRPVVFGSLVVFFGLYYYRPEDFIQPLAYIPMARLAGVLGFVTLLFGMMSGEKVKVPTAVKILWLLLLQMTICIPFALWKGGAFNTVYGKFAKGVVVAMLISMAVVTVGEIRKLLWIQVSAVAGVTFLSIALHHYNPDGRLAGIQNSILSNPNDLAINIAITFPLCLAFSLQSRGFRKILWMLAMAFMGLGVVLTASRSGLIALIICVSVSIWEYGIRGKRRQLVVATILISILAFGIAISSSHYRARVESIFLGNVEGSGDAGGASMAARKELLKKSIVTALTHPLFGVGPGCFPLLDNGWKVAHNAYTELAAESGIPALILFLLAMRAAFQNIKLVRKTRQYRDDPEFRLFLQALWAGLLGYLTGSCFASTEYNLYPYFVIGYTCAMVRISGVTLSAQNETDKDSALNRPVYANAQKPQMVLSR
jgi:O-antigen ligase/polysaccharide polymerase Wzy-like membrane protein